MDRPRPSKKNTTIGPRRQKKPRPLCRAEWDPEHDVDDAVENPDWLVGAY